MLCSIGCRATDGGFVRPGADLRKMGKVAVLPFENMTSDRFAGRKIQNLMVTEILGSGCLEVVEPGEIYKVIRTAELLTFNALNIENVKLLGERLSVPAIVLGSVHSYGVTRGAAISYPEVTIHCMLLDTASGEILASTQCTSGGTSFWTRHFKAEGATLDETAETAVKTIVRSLLSR
ncbi:MAG: CsgG/HfaB family protein [Pseudomonadota bacterium]